MTDKLKPCPFCGDIPSGESSTTDTRYTIDCGGCGLVCSCVDVRTLMTMEERHADSFPHTGYIERAKREAIKQWNTRVES